MGNPFVYVQLHTHDPAGAKDFYSQLFDWKLSDSPVPGGTYTEISVGEGTGGGLTRAASADGPSYWLPYVQVEDLEKSVASAEKLGATVIVPPAEVPGKGRYSVIQDPSGAALALWQLL